MPNTTTKPLSNIDAKDISTKQITRSNNKEPNISDKLINDINSLINQFNHNYYPNPLGGKSKTKKKKKTRSKRKTKSKTKKKKKKTRRKNKRKGNKRRKTRKKKK